MKISVKSVILACKKRLEKKSKCKKIDECWACRHNKTCSILVHNNK